MLAARLLVPGYAVTAGGMAAPGSGKGVGQPCSLSLDAGTVEAKLHGQPCSLSLDAGAVHCQPAMHAGTQPSFAAVVSPGHRGDKQPRGISLYFDLLLHSIIDGVVAAPTERRHNTEPPGAVSTSMRTV